MKAIFVSDLHLTTLEDERGQVFLRLLKSWPAQGQTHLFLLGDIFDLWLSDHRYFVQKFLPVIEELRRLRQQKIEIHYFEGNHDLYLRKYFQESVGLSVHADPQGFTLGPWKVWAEHGDQSDPKDKGYQFLRWFLRTKVMTAVAENLPESMVVKIGEKASRTSRTYTSTIKKVNRDEAIEKLHLHAETLAKTQEFDFLINGHVHVRDEFAFLHAGETRRAINLGSWLERPYFYLELTDDGFQFFEAKL